MGKKRLEQFSNVCKLGVKDSYDLVRKYWIKSSKLSVIWPFNQEIKTMCSVHWEKLRFIGRTSKNR